MKLFKRITAFFAFVICANSAIAADDPSIQGTQRTDIQAAMQQHIQSNQVAGHYVIFDGQAGGILRLSLDKLHSGIVQKGEFYVSCADFKDAKGKAYDLDFLVGKGDKGDYKVIQSLVHAVEGSKRSYHVEG